MPRSSRFRDLVTPTLASLPIGARSRLRLGVRVRSLGLFEEEKKIGVRPFFSIPNGQFGHWLSPLLPLSYSKVWKEHGITGMNYVSVSLKGSRSETLPLYDPCSPYYHAWFCVYALIGNKDQPFGFEQGKPVSTAWIPLAIADQDYWRSVATKDTIKQSYFTFQSQAEEIKLPHLGNHVFVFRCRIASYSVLTPREKQTSKGRLFLALPEEREWNKYVDPYHPLELRGLGVVWMDDKSGATFYAGGIGANFIDKFGTYHNYFPTVETELFTLLEKVRLQPLWKE